MTGGSAPDPSAARIVGYRARLGADATAKPWGPPSEAEVDARPPWPRRGARGWSVSAAGPPRPRGGPDSERSLHAPPAAPVAAPSAPPQAARPAPSPELPRGPRPAWIEEDSVQALVWERPEAAARLVCRQLLEPAPAATDPLLSGIQGVAAVLVALGPELAGEVMKHLSDYQNEEITQAIAGLRYLLGEQQGQVLEAFRRQLLSGEGVVQGGEEFARRALERAVPGRAEEVFRRVTSNLTSGFYMLRNVAPDQIAPFISHEHPQTIALILSQLDSGQAAGILDHLPETMQGDVARRIATMENIPLPVIKQLEESLEQSLRDILGGNRDVGGPKVVADILNLAGAGTEKSALDQMDAAAPGVAEAVRNLMFTFADIGRLTDHDIQRLLREVDQSDMVVALKGADEALRARFLDNMSEQVRAYIVEEMRFRGPMYAHQVEQVQLRIVQQVRQLEEQGQVTVVRGDPRPTLV